MTLARHGYPTKWLTRDGELVARFSWRDGKVCIRGLPANADDELLDAVGEVVGEWYRVRQGKVLARSET